MRSGSSVHPRTQRDPFDPQTLTAYWSAWNRATSYLYRTAARAGGHEIRWPSNDEEVVGGLQDGLVLADAFEELGYGLIAKRLRAVTEPLYRGVLEGTEGPGVVVRERPIRAVSRRVERVLEDLRRPTRKISWWITRYRRGGPEVAHPVEIVTRGGDSFSQVRALVGRHRGTLLTVHNSELVSGSFPRIGTRGTRLAPGADAYHPRHTRKDPVVTKLEALRARIGRVPYAEGAAQRPGLTTAMVQRWLKTVRSLLAQAEARNPDDVVWRFVPSDLARVEDQMERPGWALQPLISLIDSARAAYARAER